VSKSDSSSGARVVPARIRRQHAWQRAVGWLVAPIWVPAAAIVLRLGFGYRIHDVAEARRSFARLRSDSSGPLLICANHLTLIDSFLIAWALSPTWRYVVQYDSLPWNTPEETNFAGTRLARLLVFLAKCIPIRRGGSREDVAEVLDRVTYLLGRGETALLFPEGGRSRTGKICDEKAAWGVGRIVGAIDGCQVVCVYLRGENQSTWSRYPARGDRLHVSLTRIEPKSDARGVRRSRDLTLQILSQLERMETLHFEASESTLSPGAVEVGDGGQ
jgi:1-acyl-sn-glycerol-3-phosphate acyltransferase